MEENVDIKLSEEEKFILIVKETYEMYKADFDMRYGTSNMLNGKPDPTPFNNWKLEDIITYAVNYNYKTTSLLDLEEAFSELYQRQKEKEGFYVIDKVRITSNNIHHTSECSGVFSPIETFLRDEKATIFITDDKFNSRKGAVHITGNRQNLGVRYLSTFFHEAQHEQQFSNLARLFQNGRLSKPNVISAILTMFMSLEKDYFRRYIEFDAELTSIKKMFTLYKKGLITKDNDIVMLYERADRFLSNFQISKVVKSLRTDLQRCLNTVAISNPKCLRSVLATDVDRFIDNAEIQYQEIINIKAEYEKYFTSTLTDDLKDRMLDEFEYLAGLKESQFEYQGKFLEKMAIAPETIDHKRTEMFLMCYNRAVRKLEREALESNEEMNNLK